MNDKTRAGRKINVRLSRFGGFAGPAIAETTQVDDSNLSDAECDELAELVGDVEPDAPETPSRRMPDAFVYEIEIEHEGRRRKIELGDMNMTENQRSLVQWVQRRAKKK